MRFNIPFPGATTACILDFDSQSTAPVWVQSYVHVRCKPRESVDSKRVILILDLVVSA